MIPGLQNRKDWLCSGCCSQKTAAYLKEDPSLPLTVTGGWACLFAYPGHQALLKGLHLKHGFTSLKPEQ